MTNIKNDCTNCGAEMEYTPGTESQKCSYCGFVNQIEVDTETEIKEKDFFKQIEELESSALEDNFEYLTLKCDTCGATTSMDENQVAGDCPFCGSHSVAQGESKKEIKPESLLPFKVKRDEAASNFRTWLKKRWFAPNKLKEFARHDGLVGIYTPYWTYDTNTSTRYSGARGEYYYTTESYTTEEDGKSVTKTRQVRHTRWHNTSGRVNRFFDDVLVYAGGNLEKKHINKLEPWDLENLVPYSDSYVSGFNMESYTVNLQQGFNLAKEPIDKEIRCIIKRDIGGDEQKIYTVNSSYDNIKFKHLLLPLWLSTYIFKGKSYKFMVNARTGEVQGSRPYSAIKITLAVISVLAIIGAGILLYKYNS